MKPAVLLQKASLALAIGFAALAPVSFLSHPLHAQSTTSGDIAGTVTDPTGAAVPGAQVVAKDVTTGITQTATADASGNYRISLLKPDQYSLNITAAGFQTLASTVTVSAGQVSSGSYKLSVGQNSQTVQVTEAEPLLHTENADISTSFSMQQVQALPNPGNDLTFIAQTSPGATMNTTSANGPNGGIGYGNFSTFGLPAVSNTFTVNGGYENDPFLNLNNSGATNLLLGNNDVGQVTVISNAYGTQYGGLGGSQVNEISRSGANTFHGNAEYWWNGRILNANDYFLNQTHTPRAFDNVNQFAAAIGGPIKRDKTFFFVDYEGLRVVIPSSGITGAPSPAYIQSTLANIAATSPSQVPLYQRMFGVYTGSSSYARGVPNAQDPNALLVPYTVNNFTHEWLLAGRIDQRLGDKDNMFVHFKIDKGLQATYTDPFNSIFNADSPQPQYEGQLNETHIFNPNVTNQFVFVGSYYRALFTNTNLAKANAIVPFTIDFGALGGTFGTLGGEDYVWPQGRNVTGYQFIDDLSIVHGNNTIRVGWDMRRDDVTDYSPSVLTTPLVYASEGGFTQGSSAFGSTGFASGSGDLYVQQFPTRLTQPLAVYNMGGYLQDEWKALPNLTLTVGLRLERNSDPLCHTSCFAYFNGDYNTINADPSTPYNAQIAANQKRAFHSFQTVGYEPRIGFSFSPMGPGTKTVVRGGFGIFHDAFPATIADNILNNAPINTNFTIPGPAFGGSPFALDPGTPGSAATIASQSNAAFQSAFASGGSFNTISAAVPTFSAPSFTNPARQLYYPTYEEFNLQIEHQITNSMAVSVNYVGNHGYHEPVQNNSLNAYGPTFSMANADGTTTSVPAGYPDIPVAPILPTFGSVTEVNNGASSNYNGLIVSASHRSKSLQLIFNYAYSHALDEISNGGVLNFGGTTSIIHPIDPFNLRYNYGNADYDVRHNVTASYVYDLPVWRGPKALVGGWEVAGTVFHNSGFPFSVVDTGIQATNYNSTFLARRTNNVTKCGKSSIINNATGGGTPCSIASFTRGDDFGQQGRNQVFGPSYTDTDLDLLKGFGIPHWESAKINLGAQFFNLFNHPNFAPPVHDINNPNNGLITGTVNTPTSILGSGLGGNSSPRLIQLKATFTF